MPAIEQGTLIIKFIATMNAYDSDDLEVELQQDSANAKNSYGLRITGLVVHLINLHSVKGEESKNRFRN
jgi:hypothetical protein